MGVVSLDAWLGFSLLHWNILTGRVLDSNPATGMFKVAYPATANQLLFIFQTQVTTQ